jgi:hypothetical protein
MKDRIGFAFVSAALAIGTFACDQPPEPRTDNAPSWSPMVDSMGRPLGPISQNIVESNRDQVRDMNLVARIEVQPNELLEFYEPRPGVLITTGAGAPTGGPRMGGLVDAGMGTAELWARASGNVAMPLRLREAIERTGDHRPPLALRANAIDRTRFPGLRGSGPATEGTDFRSRPDRSGDADVQSHQATWCDTGFFQTGYEACYLDFRICEDNWWNGIYAYHHDTLWGRATVCAATGEMFLHTQTDDSAWPTYVFTVPQDTYRWRSISDGACRYPGNDCPFYRAEVLGASGKRFHFRFLVDEE